MSFEYPESIPATVRVLPAAWMTHREALARVLSRYPALVEGQDVERDFDAVTGTYAEGKHVDVWGCVWTSVRAGMEAFVTGHPVATREAVHKLKVPEEDTGFPHGFMFLRLQYLRGFREIMTDFAEEPPELQMLIDRVLEYNLRQARLLIERLPSEPQIVYFGDDLGMQKALPISPAKWRKYLKPCYELIYRPIREAGHYVYMHTDGHVIEIIGDLIECGVNVLNLQVRANGLDNIAQVCKGKVCVDLDLDRQLFPFCKPDDIEAHVREVVDTLGAPEGGLWLTAEIGADVPIENVEAICAALERHRHRFR
mgnify:CR=1 FL=1